MSISGWMDANGKFHGCDMFGHIDKITNTPELARHVERLDEMLMTLESIDQSCQEAADNEEHPEWHNYDMYQYDVLDEIRMELLKAGCLRVGTWHTHGTMHFEGTLTATTHQAAIDLADGYDLEPVFEDVK